MRRTTWLTAALAQALIAAGGCSSSSSSAGGSSYPPTCKNPSPAEETSPSCLSCQQSHCESQIATFESNCQAWLSCYSGCDCNDTTCVQGCYPKYTGGTCIQAGVAPLNMCDEQECESQCLPPIADAGGG